MAAQFERTHLQDHRQRLEHEQPAGDDQQQLLFDQHRGRAQRSTQPHRSHVAHEDLGRVAVEPQEAQTGAHDRSAKHGDLAHALDVGDRQVIGDQCVTHRVGQHGEGGPDDQQGADGQAVEPVGEVDRIRRSDQHE